MSEPGEIPRPAWLQREQSRLDPKKVGHGINAGPVQQTPGYREKVETKAAEQIVTKPLKTPPPTLAEVGLKQAIAQGQKIREQTQPLGEQPRPEDKFKPTRSLKDILKAENSSR